MKNGFYFENKRKAKEAEFKENLKKHLPEILAELIRENTGGISSNILKMIEND